MKSELTVSFLKKTSKRKNQTMHNIINAAHKPSIRDKTRAAFSKNSESTSHWSQISAVCGLNILLRQQRNAGQDTPWRCQRIPSAREKDRGMSIKTDGEGEDSKPLQVPGLFSILTRRSNKTSDGGGVHRGGSSPEAKRQKHS